MKYSIYFVVGLLIWNVSWGQNDGAPGINDFMFVDQEPVPQNMSIVRDSIGYPQAAIDSSLEGTVIARTLVNSEGNYVQHKIISKTDSILNEAVDTYISDLVFTPATLDGKEVDYWVNLPFIFRLVTEENSAQAAITLFSQKLNKDPEDYITWMQRGLQYKDVGQFDLAIKDFTSSLTYNPPVEKNDSADISSEPITSDSTEHMMDSVLLAQQYRFYALFARGTTLGSVGKYDSALVDLTQAIEEGEAINNPDSTILATLPNAYTERGYIHFLLEDSEAALKDYQLVISNSPGIACAVYPLVAELFLAEKDYDNIIDTYNKMLECNPKDELLYYSRGYYKTEAGKFEESIADLTFAAENSPNSNLRIASHNRKAWALYQIEKYEEALQAAEDAIAVNVLSAQSYYYKGLITLAQENKELACDSFKKSMEYGISGEELTEVRELLNNHCQ